MYYYYSNIFNNNLINIDAKSNAIKAMKAKIVNEYRKREAVTGVGKMKWDAQIR